ncbi:MAG: alpha/beta hydrolase [Chloroflexi bacterium]|nr:alpha/beta hydrolase [Chloroflexota bacterium]MBP7045377.1 alpha/beta hydrolase [Chloroflexota bacterium]
MIPTHRLLLPDGATLAYEDIGSKRLLLLIHGFTGTARAHLGTLIDGLQTHYRLIAPDLRGYGASQPPTRSFPLDFYHRDADDMAVLLRHVDCGPVAALGFSDGAEIAILLAALYPELVRGVVTWGVSGVISPEMVTAVQSRVPVPAKPNWGAWHRQIAALHGEAQVEPMIRGWNEAAAAILAQGGNVCLDEAAHVHCPTLLLNGDGEVGNTLRDVTRLLNRLPDGRLEIIAHSGHPIHDDQPDLFLQKVTDFLTRLDLAEG